MKHLIAILLLIPLCFSISEAKITLPSIIGDNMVLQQKSEVALWGHATPLSKVSIKASWSRKPISTNAGTDGKWNTTLSTPQAGGPYEIEISDGEKLTIKNILIGEVWLCSGQSNMEMPMEGFWSQPITGATDILLQANAERPIRMCTITKNPELNRSSECQASWQENTPWAIRKTSATAYLFADYLQKVLNIPVGIIISSWGGTAIESWMSQETLESSFKEEFDLTFLSSNQKPDKAAFMPCTLFNGMLSPIIPYTIKGFLWYQGESNCGRAEQYIRLQTAFANMLRKEWNNPDMPFYYVQIAPFKYPGQDAYTAPKLREAQLKCLSSIPNSGMVVTADIGDYDCIHPTDKANVGKRLAYLALRHDYDKDFIEADCPTFTKMQINGTEAILTFSTGDVGLAPLGHSLTGFEIAGEDKIFYPAEAYIIDKWRIVVKCNEVPCPIAVRYCFTNNMKPSLYNESGIPVSPFRTDSW